MIVIFTLCKNFIDITSLLLHLTKVWELTELWIAKSPKILKDTHLNLLFVLVLPKISWWEVASQPCIKSVCCLLQSSTRFLISGAETSSGPSRTYLGIYMPKQQQFSFGLLSIFRVAIVADHVDRTLCLWEVFY